MLAYSHSEKSFNFAYFAMFPDFVNFVNGILWTKCECKSIFIEFNWHHTNEVSL